MTGRKAEFMSRIDDIDHRVLIEGVAFMEAREFIEGVSDEVYYVPPGYKVLDEIYLVGIPPVVLGIKGSRLLFPVVRPRLGTSVVEAGTDEDVNRLRKKLKSI